MPINTGLVGFGISAKVFHAPFLDLNPHFRLTKVVERNRQDSKSVYPDVEVDRSMEELLKDESIELVVITTPNETHFPYAKQALLAGKHVVLEKPFTNTTAEAEELINLAENTGMILSVYQNRRYVSDFLTIREVLQSKQLGEIHEFIARYDRYRAEARPAAWREAPLKGSGILYDLGPHLIDQALHLFGMPKSVTADIRLQRPHARVDDYFEIWLDYGFLKVSLHAGMLVREMGPRYMIHGTSGSFVKYGEDPQEAALRAGQKPEGELWGREPEEHYGIIHTEKAGQIVREVYPSLPGSYNEYYNNIYASIRQGAPVRETAIDGYNTIRIIGMAIESHAAGKTIRL